MRKPPAYGPGADGWWGSGRCLFCRWGEGVVNGGAEGVGGDASRNRVTSHRGDLLGELFELLPALLLGENGDAVLVSANLKTLNALVSEGDSTNPENS